MRIPELYLAIVLVVLFIEAHIADASFLLLLRVTLRLASTAFCLSAAPFALLLNSDGSTKTLYTMVGDLLRSAPMKAFEESDKWLRILAAHANGDISEYRQGELQHSYPMTV